MHYRVLLRALKKKPFAPFNILMSSGTRYLIDHPENISISKDAVIIPIYYHTPRREISDDFVYASYLHIAALEPVQMPTTRRRQQKSPK